MVEVGISLGDGLENKRRSFTNKEEQSDYDARNIIALTARINRQTGRAMNPVDLLQRKEDGENTPSGQALRSKIAKKFHDITPEVAASLIGEVVRGEASSAGVECMYELRMLQRLRLDYQHIPERIRSNCSWEDVATRLLDNNAYYLRLADAMEGGGVLFGVDREGNPLIADKGEEAIMVGKSYNDTIQDVYNTEKLGEFMRTGYEMFPIGGAIEMGPQLADEVFQFEQHGMQPFVRKKAGNKGGQWTDKPLPVHGSWLFNGADAELTHVAYSMPGLTYRSGMSNALIRVTGQLDSKFDDPELTEIGVRRLLRVRKSETRTVEAEA